MEFVDVDKTQPLGLPVAYSGQDFILKDEVSASEDTQPTQVAHS